ncbi:MAG: ribosome maturation factor RimP [Gammaproteobacteria bacterium]|nr:ribosome maturation factor RimP [Gammaproteobacteria bacterium]
MNQSVLQTILEPVIAGLGFELLGIERLGDRAAGTVRIYIDHPQGVTIDDCETVSSQVGAILDVEGVIAGSYVLEVSSPGLDRPLFTPAHFVRFVGSTISVRLHQRIEGRRKLEGVLQAADQDGFVLVSEGQTWPVPYTALERARLVPQWPETKRRRQGSGKRATNARG